MQDQDQSGILISVVIVNYKVPEYLREALRSLRQAALYDKCEIIVVDNASHDNSRQHITAEFLEVTWIQLKSNIGFGKACNVGAQNARGTYLLILNPDTVVSRNTLCDAVEFMRAHPEIGLMGPKILNPDGSLQASCRRGNPTPAVVFYHFSGLSKLFPRSPRFGRYNLTYMDPDESSEVDAISGSFMLMPRALFDEISGFDERFFMYGEDLDLCWRIREKGYKVWFYPATQIIHLKGKSSAKHRLKSRIAFYEAMVLFSRKYRHKHGSFFPVWLIYLGIVFFVGMRLGATLIRTLTACLIDLSIINVALWAGISIRFLISGKMVPYLGAYSGTMLGMHALLSACFIFMFAYNGIYSEKRYSVANALLSGLLASVLFMASVYFIQSMAFSRIAFALASIAISFLLVGWREVLPKMTLGIKRLIYKPDKVIIVGSGPIPSLLIKNIEVQKSANIAGIIWTEGRPWPGQFEGYPVLGSLDDIQTVLRRNKVDMLLLATPRPWYSQIIETLACSKAKNLTIRWVPHDLFELDRDKLPKLIPLHDFSV